MGSETNLAEFKNVTFDNYVVDSFKKLDPDVNYEISGFVNQNYGHISGINIRNGKFMFNVKEGDIAGFVYQNKEEGIIENCSVDMKSEKLKVDAGFVYENCGKITNSKTISSYFSCGFVDTNRCSGIIEGCSSTGNVTFAGFAGENQKGIITNCTATGTLTPRKKNSGRRSGFVGWNTLGTIKNCSTSVDINGGEEVGGFIYFNRGGTIINCEATGNVAGGNYSDKCDADSAYACGFIVKNESGEFPYYKYYRSRSDYGEWIKEYGKARIEGCQATGEVKSESSAAGFVGCNSSEIADCTASGSVTGKKLAGGFVGQHGYVIYDKFNENYNKYYSGSIKGCKATGDVQGKECAGGFAGTNKCYSEIIECSAEGNTIGEECVGGFVGMNEWNGNIIKCTATGNATANTLRKTMKCGGFAGTNSGRGIEGCTAKGKATAISKKAGTAKAYAGGFVGENTGGKIDGCEATGGAEAKSSLGEAIAGGFVGVAEKCNITNSKSSGAVYLSSGFFSKDDGCGGFVGKNNAKSVIENCSAKCEVETTRGNKGGGFVGEAEDGSTIKNCTCESVRVKKGKTISSLNELIEKSFYYKKSDKAEIL